MRINPANRGAYGHLGLAPERDKTITTEHGAITLQNVMLQDENEQINAFTSLRAALNNIEPENVRCAVVVIVTKEGLAIMPGYNQDSMVGIQGTKVDVEAALVMAADHFEAQWGKHHPANNAGDGEAAEAAEAFSAPLHEDLSTVPHSDLFTSIDGKNPLTTSAKYFGALALLAKLAEGKVKTQADAQAIMAQMKEIGITLTPKGEAEFNALLVGLPA